MALWGSLALRDADPASAEVQLPGALRVSHAQWHSLHAATPLTLVQAQSQKVPLPLPLTCFALAALRLLLTQRPAETVFELLRYFLRLLAMIWRILIELCFFTVFWVRREAGSQPVRQSLTACARF